MTWCCLECRRRRRRMGIERHSPVQITIERHASTLLGSRRSRKNLQDILRHRIYQPCQNQRLQCCSDTTMMSRFAFCVRRESTMNRDITTAQSESDIQLPVSVVPMQQAAKRVILTMGGKGGVGKTSFML